MYVSQPGRGEGWGVAQPPPRSAPGDYVASEEGLSWVPETI